MGAVIIGLGVVVTLIGAVLAVNGLAIYQSTFGNALVTLGGIGVVGGLTLFALGFIHRALMQIVDRLDGVVHFEPEEEVHEPVSAAPSAHHAPAAAPRPSAAPAAPPAPVTPVAPVPVAPVASEPLSLREALARPSVAPQPAPEPARPSVPEPVVPSPAMPELSATPAEDEGSGLPAWFRRKRAPAAPLPPEPEFDAEPDDEPEPAEPVRHSTFDEPEFAEAPRWLQSRGPRREPVFRDAMPYDDPPPRHEERDEAELGGAEPIIPRQEKSPAVEAPEREPAEGAPADAGPGAPPAFLRHDEPSEDDGEPVREDAPATQPEPSVTVLKSGTIGGMAYTLYTDGSIEAELPGGAIRFASLQQLREHVAGGAAKAADDAG